MTDDTTPRERFLAAAAAACVGVDIPRLEAALDEYRNAIFETIAGDITLAGTLARAITGGNEREAEIVEGCYQDIAASLRSMYATDTEETTDDRRS